MAGNNRTKVMVNRNSPYDEIKVGDVGYIDGYVTEVTTHFAIVVFENGDILPVHISRLKAL